MSIEYTTTRKTMQGGFSLVELMVSMFIFGIVMIISIGTLLVLVDANEKAQSEYSAMTNLTFAVDSMTREIRTGYDYYCSPASLPESGTLPDSAQDCNGANVDDEIAFNRGRDDVRVGYRLEGGEIQQRVANNPWLSVTSPDLIVTRFDVQVKGAEPPTDTIQPTVAILIAGYVDDGTGTDIDFFLQTEMTHLFLGY
jgi:prepilin-type N-terminal cleavage/methylation domain-containing protein